MKITNKQQYEGYKANLLQNARCQMSKTGGKIRVAHQHVTFWNKDGHKISVWFPFESRVNDLEIADMKEAIQVMSGYKAFTL